MINLVIKQGGGGVEVAGALQAVADLMLQSVTLADGSGATYLALFPLSQNMSVALGGDASFHGLRGKGGFVVSASFDAGSNRISSPVSMVSEVGGLCTLQLPPKHAIVSIAEEPADGHGHVQPIRFKADPVHQGRFSFHTTAATKLRITVAGAEKPSHGGGGWGESIIV